MSSKKNNKKLSGIPCAVKEMEREFPEVAKFNNESHMRLIVGWLTQTEGGACFIAITAEVKSGKRRLKQHIGTKIQDLGHDVKVFVVTSLIRNECKEQWAEFEELDINICLLRTHEHAAKVSTDISRCLLNGYKVLVLIDEGDYGSGKAYVSKQGKEHKSQCLGEVITTFANDPRVCFTTYSATDAEIVFGDRNPHRLLFSPSENYRGAAWYLNEGLVHEAMPFFDSEGNLLEQGTKILEGLVDSEKIFAVTRCPNGAKEYPWLSNLTNPKARKMFLQRLQLQVPGLTDVVVVNGANGGWNWGPPKNSSWGGFVLEGNCKVLVIVVQMAKRSTELDKGFLRRLYAWHDYRSEHKTVEDRKNACFNTMIQAMLRVAHHVDRVNPETDICPQLYGHVASIKLAAQMISYSEWAGKLGQRMSSHELNGYNYERVIVRDDEITSKCVQKTSLHTNRLKNEFVLQRIADAGYKSCTGNEEIKPLWVFNNGQNLCQSVYNGAARSTEGGSGGIVMYYLGIEPPAHWVTNPTMAKNLESFEKIKQDHPEWLGCWHILVPTSLKVDGYSGKLSSRMSVRKEHSADGEWRVTKGIGEDAKEEYNRINADPTLPMPKWNNPLKRLSKSIGKISEQGKRSPKNAQLVCSDFFLRGRKPSFYSLAFILDEACALDLEGWQKMMDLGYKPGQIIYWYPVQKTDTSGKYVHETTSASAYNVN